MQRENLGSRLGFILISAGCAIGIGNVWKFPYLCGQSGGGIFVLVYLFFLIIIFSLKLWSRKSFRDVETKYFWIIDITAMISSHYRNSALKVCQ